MARQTTSNEVVSRICFKVKAHSVSLVAKHECNSMYQSVDVYVDGRHTVNRVGLKNSPILFPIDGMQFMYLNPVLNTPDKDRGNVYRVEQVGGY